MAQLIKGGPDLPPEVLQAQEEGELVLFCGAGVSKPAGLPLFGELVEKIYEELAEAPTHIEKRLCRQGLYDRALELLERREIKVREVLRGLLTKSAPDLRVHRALLTLAEVPGGHRIVTTNFDRLFLQALSSLSPDAAPTLPVPRKHRWLSLVHLHGLISDADPGSRNLVLTSGDFGRAYLLDGWAARFVSELFRNFTVLFIGYGVDDPVMRYLTDAIAAEQRQGASFRQPFAFAGVSSGGTRDREADEWRSKGVNALTYQKGWKHRALVETLDAWAELRRGGFQRRRTIALKHASRPPESWRDEEARLVVWALSEPSGNIAKAFAEHEPAPPIEWLSIFTDSEELPEKASLLSMPVLDAAGKPVKVSSPLVGLAPTGRASPVTVALASWLTRHLGDHRVLDWVLRRGGLMHESFRRKVREQLSRGNGIPAPLRTIWGILACEDYARRLADRWQPNLSFLDRRITEEPWSPLLRAEVLRALAPIPSLREAWRDPAEERPLTVGRFVSIDMELSDRDFGTELVQRLVAPGYESRQEILAELALPVTSLLWETLEWFALLGEADEGLDPSVGAMPSIEPHPQNRHFEPWVHLIDLARESFLALDRANPEEARFLVSQWRSVRFPLFRRLTLYAATHGQGGNPMVGFQVLTEREHVALWRSDTKRECMRFLRCAAVRLPKPILAELLGAILAGPPRSPEWEAADPDGEQRWRTHAVWSRLVRLSHGAVQLPAAAHEELIRLSRLLGREPVEDEQDEFATWLGDEWVGHSYSVAELLQLGVGDLALLLGQGSEEPMERQSLMLAWQGLVAEAPDKVLAVFQHLAEQNRWVEDAWRYALNGKSELLSYPDLCALLLRAPERLVSAEIHSIARWLAERARKLAEEDENLLWQLSERILPLALAAPVHNLTDHPLNTAINHPAGTLAELAVHRLSARSPERGQGLSDNLRSILDALGREQSDAGAVARILLATHLRLLRATDAAWFDETLLPRLAWSCPEARLLWQGFFWQPRADADLMAVIKPAFIEAFQHLDELGSTAANACRFLTFGSLGLPGAFTRAEVSSLLKELAPPYLAEVAGALASSLRSLGDDAGVGWHERIGLWFRQNWPGRPQLRTPEVSEALAEVALETGDALVEAVEGIKHFLVPIPRPASLEHWLEKSNQPERAPRAVVELLDAVVPSVPEPPWWWRLGGLLDRIESADRALARDLRFRRLRDVAVRATP